MAGTSPSGRSGFVKLAIRVLSILPNSAGPEHTFSIFGLTHTKHRNRLDPHKVHDATTVRMDRQKAHIAAGLVPEHNSRHFSIADDETEEAAAAANADPSDFDVMTEVLINLALEEPSEDEEPPVDPPQSQPPPQMPSASQTVNDAAGHVPAYKKIKLADLFNYPTPRFPSRQLRVFLAGWSGRCRS